MTVLAFPRAAFRPRQPEAPAAAEADSGAGRAGLAIRVEGLVKAFGASRVLDGIDLEIRPGEFVAIVGHSGCGKSTLLRLIAGLDTPTGGRVAADGASVAGQLARARLMFQDARLLPWRKVIDNVGLGAKGGWRPAAREALAGVGLAERSGDWPTVLSGGQRQRVALARALLAQPGLLLLDEPLGALDALTRLEMQSLVETVWREKGFTAVLVTHDVGEAVSLADRVIVLKAGRIAHVEPVNHARPRRRGNAALAEIEGRILGHLMNR